MDAPADAHDVTWLHLTAGPQSTGEPATLALAAQPCRAGICPKLVGLARSTARESFLAGGRRRDSEGQDRPCRDSRVS